MKILVIGGYGNFGKRLVNSLLSHHQHEIIIAGRSVEKCREFQRSLFSKFNKKIDISVFDVFSVELNSIFQEISPEIVVNVVGPYQFQSGITKYPVAKACLKAGCHYVDLADDRKFVSEFADQFDQRAKQKQLVMVTGASTVPALTCAIIDHYKKQFAEIKSLYYGISPGNRTERGSGTVSSILSYTGQPFETLMNGQPSRVFGWQDLARYDFEKPIGKRWMGNCDIPDLELLPARYPQLKNIRFQAGLKVSILHLGLWLLSFFSRCGLVKNWNRYTKILTIMSEWFISLGSDSGGMFVELKGIGDNRQNKKIVWQLVAEKGTGVNVPTISAEIIIDKISLTKLQPGATACVGLFELDDFFGVASRWGIQQKVRSNEY